MPREGSRPCRTRPARPSGPSQEQTDAAEAGRRMTTTLGAAALLSSGRYAIFHAGIEVGEERWTVEAVPGGGAIARAEQVLSPPHPLASELSWRAELTPEGRIATLETEWRVGTRTVRAEHAASGQRWHARVSSGGHSREQGGDFPGHAEVAFGSHVLQ